MPSFHDLTTAQLKEAVKIRQQIESLQAKLSTLIGGTASPKPKAGRPAGKRKMSPESRAKMAAGQKARWAKVKSPIDEPVAKKKGSITPEGRAKLAAVMKARWAARKKGAPALNAPAK